MIFVVLPNIHLLDLAGPAQVFYTAARVLNLPYALSFCAATGEIRSAQGLYLSHLEPFPAPSKDNLILLPGTKMSFLNEQKLLDEQTVQWVKENHNVGAQIASICSGVFALGEAGLLHRRRCTAHWEDITLLQTYYPTSEVIEGVLYIHDRGIITSAGVTSGIDMSLWLLEQKWGPRTAAEVARQLIIYLRRNGFENQVSIFLEYRTHLNPTVHRVQDWLIEHFTESTSLDHLAKVGRVSISTLTRTFKEVIGITPHDYQQLLRLEVASHLLNDSNLSLEMIAAKSGFNDARHFRRIWKQHVGDSPSSSRRRNREKTQV